MQRDRTATLNSAASISNMALVGLLQLASPSLPVGGYSYSQGLESAIAAGIVSDESSARTWVSTCLRHSISTFDAPMLRRLLEAFAERDPDAIQCWSDCYLASRDTPEFRAETVQMGYSLKRLILDAPLGDPAVTMLLDGLTETPLPTAFACAAVALDIPHDAAMLGFLFSWIENQVLVCVKTIPLGQVAGQRLLLSLHAELTAAATTAMLMPDDALSNWSPGLSILSMQHETQYSRLYRS